MLRQNDGNKNNSSGFELRLITTRLDITIMELQKQKQPQTKRTDPNQHHVRLHLAVRLRHPGLPVLAQNLHHHSPSKQKRETANNEQRQLQARLQASLLGGQRRGRPQQPAAGRQRGSAGGAQRWSHVDHLECAQFG